MSESEINLSQKQLDMICASVPDGGLIYEWGCGLSTVRLTKRGYVVVSVEHDKDWFEQISKRLSNTKSTVLHVSPDHGHDGYEDGTTTQFFRYATKPLQSYVPGDVRAFIIDGRARLACARVASLLCDNNPVFMHDFAFSDSSRIPYQHVMGLFEIEDAIGSLVKMRVKR